MCIPGLSSPDIEGQPSKDEDGMSEAHLESFGVGIRFHLPMIVGCISTISPLFSAHPSVTKAIPNSFLDVHQLIHNSSVFHILFHHFSIDDSQPIGIVVFYGRLSHDFTMVSTRNPNGPSAKKHEPQERLVKAAQIDLEETGNVEEGFEKLWEHPPFLVPSGKLTNGLLRKITIFE